MTDPSAPTDDASAGDAAAEAGAGTGADLGRRRFFRQFANEIVNSAATMAGLAGALQRSSAEAASVLLRGDAPDHAAPGAGLTDMTNPAAGVAAGFRTAYRWNDDTLTVIDQRRLPSELVEETYDSGAQVAWAIREMVIRGAPAIGQVAAIGLALTAHRMRSSSPFVRRTTLRGTAATLVNARPTAVNVRWATDRCLAAVEAVDELNDDGELILAVIRREAEAIVAEAAEDHERLARLCLAELPLPEGRPLNLLTHCNTGPLACGQFGTALGVVQVAAHDGRDIHVYVDETRPYLQGARLTAWELAQANVAHTLLADSAAGWLLATHPVDAVLVGADRIAANGDTANKIGTYPLAVLARRHGVPLYVCAPTSSVDLDTADGAAIPIEQRSATEVTTVRGTTIAPPETVALNPAFDVTPAELITTIVTEEGVLRSPFGPGLAGAVAAARARRTAAAAAESAMPAGSA